MILKVTVICKDGEIFILKMPSVRIETLAREMLKFFIKKNKIKKKITINIGKSREGEKLHEYRNNLLQKKKKYQNELHNRLKSQKGIMVEFSEVKNTNHFFKDKEEDLKKIINTYIKKNTELI